MSTFTFSSNATLELYADGARSMDLQDEVFTWLS